MLLNFPEMNETLWIQCNLMPVEVITVDRHIEWIWNVYLFEIVLFV